MSFNKPYELSSPSGASLSVRSAKPKRKPKAIIHILHGMAEHSERYGRFADALTKAGYGVFAHDHRGHGHTTAPNASLGSFGDKGWDGVITDVHAVSTHIGEQHPGVPIIVFGHSMGAIICFNYILRHPGAISGGAIWNSGVETGFLGVVFRLILKFERFRKGSDVPSTVAQKLTFETWNKDFAPNRTEFDWLSRDNAEVDKYIADPLCGFPVTNGLWQDLIEGIYYAADDSNLTALPKDLPVHLQAGAKDPCSMNGKAIEHIEVRMKRAGMNDVTFKLLDDTRHESLNEINRDAVTADFIAWLNARFGT